MALAWQSITMVSHTLQQYIQSLYTLRFISVGQADYLTRCLLADGSSYYKIQDNFEVYGGHKSNFGGHNKLRSGALIPFSKVYQEGLCCRVNSQSHDAQHTDGYFNNTCIQSAVNLTVCALASLR